MGHTDRHIELLEDEIVNLKKENDKLRGEVSELLSEADAVGWALTEMNLALGRAKDAEVRAAGLERKVKVLESKIAALETAGVQPDTASDTPDPVPVRLTRVTSPHAAMEDLLGFPKEGR